MTRTPASPMAPMPSSGWNGTPQLADDDDVERRAEGAGDLEGDRYPAPRQAKYHDTVT